MIVPQAALEMVRKVAYVTMANVTSVGTFRERRLQHPVSFPTFNGNVELSDVRPEYRRTEVGR